MFTIPIAGGGLGAGSNLKFEILHSVKLPTSCILHSAGLIREMSRILRFIHRNRASPFDRQPRGRTMLSIYLVSLLHPDRLVTIARLSRLAAWLHV